MQAFSAVYDTYRDATLAAFRKRGGKLLIFHGTADPIFSALESIDYYQRLARNNGGPDATARWARLFLVPGMNHCAGGPATDSFDGLAAIVDWVEKAPPRRASTRRRGPARRTSPDGRVRSARIRSMPATPATEAWRTARTSRAWHHPTARPPVRHRPCAASSTGFTARATPSGPSPSIAMSSASSSRDRRLPAPPRPARRPNQSVPPRRPVPIRSSGISRTRTARASAPCSCGPANTPFGLELSEFFDIARGDRAANPWDPGASALIFSVRDLDAVAGRLKARGAPVVTLGGAALTTPGGRAVLVRDPDGYLIEARQAPPAAVAKATAPGDVIETSIDITVASRERAREFYEKLLGFTIKGTRTASAAELRLHGLAGGTLTETAMSIPGTAVTVVLSEFALPAGTTPPARRFDWRLQDVGSPQFQLEVSGLDALIDRTKNAGYRFLSVGAKPIQRAFGRFVFAIDPDAVLVEFVEPADVRAIGARPLRQAHHCRAGFFQRE